MAMLEKVHLSQAKQALLVCLANYHAALAHYHQAPHDPQRQQQWAEQDAALEQIASKIAYLEDQLHHAAPQLAADEQGLHLPQTSPLQNSIVWGIPPLELELAEIGLATKAVAPVQASLKDRVQRLITYFKNPVAFQEAAARDWLQKGNSQADVAERLASYSQALQLNPQLSAAYFQRGTLYYQQGQYAEALADFTQALHWDSNYLEAYHNRALTHYRRNHYDEALADFTTMLGILPDSPEIYYNRAVVHQKKGDYRNTLADATTSIALQNPHGYLPYQLRGEVQRLKKNYRQAVDDCTAALAIHPKYYRALSTRGAVYVAVEEVELALEDLEAALHLNPMSSFTKYWLIIIKKRWG